MIGRTIVVNEAAMTTKFELGASEEEYCPSDPTLTDAILEDPQDQPSERRFHGERRGRFLIETGEEDIMIEGEGREEIDASGREQSPKSEAVKMGKQTTEMDTISKGRVPKTGTMDIHKVKSQLAREVAKDTFPHFVENDRFKRSKRKYLLSILHPECISNTQSWSHLGALEATRRVPFIEPAVLRGTAAGRLEFPREVPGSQVSQPVITRRAITTLITGVLRKRYLDIPYILNRILLAVVDEEEENACLVLHVVFGLSLPSGLCIKGHKIPELMSSASRGVLKKRTHYRILQRIFLLAILRGMDSLCLMLLEANFPKNLDVPIYSTRTYPSQKNPSISHQLFPSPFQMAVSYGRSRLVRVMLNKGASPASAWMGLTPLMLACCVASEKRSLAMVRELLLAKADPQVVTRADLVDRLFGLRRLAPTSTRHDGATAVVSHTDISAIEFAAATGHPQVIRELLKYLGPKSNTVKDSTMCLLVQANPQITIQLILAGASLSQRDQQGNTALHLAAAKGVTSLMISLLQAGADIDATNSNGWTALHFAARRGNREAMRLLIAKGADCSVENNQGKTALQVALKSGIPSEDLIDFFRKHEGATPPQEFTEGIDALHYGGAGGNLEEERPKKTKGRFLIEKILGLPRYWLSAISNKQDSNRSEK